MPCGPCWVARATPSHSTHHAHRTPLPPCPALPRAVMYVPLTSKERQLEDASDSESGDRSR